MTQVPSYYKKVVSATVVSGGAGYTSAPEVTFVGGKSGTSTSAFSTAAGIAIIENGSVVAIEITNEGFDYLSTPEITFTGGGGAGASATANLLPIDSIYGDFVGSLGHLIQHQVPAFVRKEYPQFVLFLEKYYQFLEQDNQANNIILQLESFTDIHRTLDLFIPQFRSQYLKYFPKNTRVDERLLIKFIREFYEAKGSEKSIKFLFRLLFDENIEIYYPSENILRASDGVWITDNVIRITPADSADVFSLKGKIVDVVSYLSIGSITSQIKTEVIILDVRKLAYTSPAIYELIVDRNISNIPVPGFGATATITLAEDYTIDTIQLDNPGFGYFANPEIVINSYTGSGASAKAIINSNGNVSEINLVDSGSLYGGTTSGGEDYYFDGYNFLSDGDWPQVIEKTFRFNSDDPTAVTEIYVNINSTYHDSSAWLQDIADQIIDAGNTGYLTLFSNSKQFLYKVTAAAVDNTALYDYWKFVVEYQWGTDGNFANAEPCTIAFSPIVVVPTVEFSTQNIATSIFSKTNVRYGDLLRILSYVTIDEAYLASGETNYGFKDNTIYDITESGSTGLYAFAGYFAGDYVQPGINNKASVKIVSVDEDGLPTKIAIAFSGYGFQSEEFIATITSPNGSQLDIICRTGSQYTTTGRFKDSRGFLSDANKLQDNYYYQNYSYVIRSSVSSRNWIEIVKNTVHPAGMAVFGELMISEHIDFSPNITILEEKLHLYEFPMEVASVQTFVFEVDFVKTVFDTATQKAFDRDTDYLVSIDKPFVDQTINYDNAIILSGKGESDFVSSADFTDITVSFNRDPVDTTTAGNETVVFGLEPTKTDFATQKEFDRDTDYLVNFSKQITYQDDLELVGEYVFDPSVAYFAEDYVEEPGIDQIIVNTVDSNIIETGKNVNEILSGTNDVINNFVVHKVLVDTVIATETINGIQPVFMIPNDDPIITDSAEITVHKFFTDGVSTADTTISETGLSKTDTTYYYEHQHSLHETISISSNEGTQIEILHTNEDRSASVSKSISENSTTTDSGVINIQDYWSADFASGDFVGAGYSF